ncbi:related to phosphatidic acid-preferring phospholipase A1 [Melanopsichium pennsylvanicum]|uniref:Related to phosphatidic acid-preferring phospholipase A1 n=2 Tax=Melanopsichium pennsylvanicum TaxID=63383 RepID=A0AAJ5C4D9_9BASI|nr:related to phosphatidic acid-preferring phospholipase A1 [Melanopsichium pennsylvanicum]
MSRTTSESGILSPPPHRARWMYARGDTWATFQPHDNDKLERKWNELGGDDWARRRNQQAQDLCQDEKRKSTTSKPRAPPSGVDAIQSALDGFTNLSHPSKRDSRSAHGQLSKDSSAGSSWISDLRSYMSFAKDDAADHGSNTDSDEQRSSNDDSKKSDDDSIQVNYILDPDQPQAERAAKVEVMEDNLFDVDLESMTLYPVFWKGVLLKVVRATWFYSSLTDGSYAPISGDDPLSQDLDDAYSKAQPWLYQSNATTDGDSDNHTVGEETNKSNRYPLTSMKDKGQVCFQDAQVGRIFSQDLRGRFLSIVGGSIVVRGFDRAEEIAKQKSFSPLFNTSLPWANGHEKSSSTNSESSSAYTESQRKGSSAGAHSASKRQGAAKTSSAPPSGGGADGSNRADASSNGDKDERRSFAAKLVPSSDAALRPLVTLKKLFDYDENKAADEEKRKMKQQMTEDELDRQRRAEDDLDLLPDDCKDQPPELVFAVHGIGQQLTEDFEALDFVYDIEHLRNLASENASDPAVRRLSRGRRAQFIPICWRRFMEFDDRPGSNDNFYTLDDITNSAAIPIVRNVITKVVLDVPFYLSRHRKKMIDSVTSELNRTYRLFCRRNPNFEKDGGRVSIIGHSLGSALAADILSAQPSKVPPLSEVEKSDHDKLRSNSCLHFNVKNLFFIGSPVAFFFHLEGGQLIARSGTERHPANDSDALDDGMGRYGCLAAENVYNIFNPNDPVAFQLAPTVDSAYAKVVKPISIESATEALLRSLTLPRISVSRIFEKYKEHPFQGVGKIVRQARILADEEDQLPYDLSKGDKRQLTERERGRRIVEDSDYIRTVRKWQHLNTSKPTASDYNHEAPTPDYGELETELGTRKKTLQPEMALRIAFGTEESDEKHDFDLESLERAERRFRALNPHGCIDYHLSASISLSGYLDMFGAHLAYWAHRDFAVFVLTQLFMDFTNTDEVTIVPQIQGTENDKEDSDDDDEEAEGDDEEDQQIEDGEKSEDDERAV